MRSVVFLALLCFVGACATLNKRPIIRELDQLEQDFHHHTGFYLYDPSSRKTLINKNGDKYFTPASNTKIFTFFAVLNVLGDSLPGLYYQQKDDSLIFWGTGDPSLLYPYLPASNVTTLLAQSTKNLFYSSANFDNPPLGPGWAWDDYNYTYSVERTPLPIYGNAFLLKKQANTPYLEIDQPYFKNHIWLGDSTAGETLVEREIGSNRTKYQPSTYHANFEYEVPFRYSDKVLAALLSSEINRPIAVIHKPLPASPSVVKSIPTDSALKVMMQESDNFISEQLLMMCAGVLTGTLNSHLGIDTVKKAWMKGMPGTPVWVDGSGLSRYNLFTPRSIVWLWDELLKQFGSERLFPLLATGGKNGTIKRYYKADPPYIFGKTGTLRNNHALSGYLITKKGKILIFSFMNNHYNSESYPIKKRMEKILWEVREKY